MSRSSAARRDRRTPKESRGATYSWHGFRSFEKDRCGGHVVRPVQNYLGFRHALFKTVPGRKIMLNSKISESYEIQSAFGDWRARGYPRNSAGPSTLPHLMRRGKPS